MEMMAVGLGKQSFCWYAKYYSRRMWFV